MLAGAGDLDAELRDTRPLRSASRIACASPACSRRTTWPRYLAAADVVAVPSVRDDAGNVDGLPNVVMEALASAHAGGRDAGRRHRGGRRGRRDRTARARARRRSPWRPPSPACSSARDEARRSVRPRALVVQERYGWDRVAERFEAAYDAAAALPR